MSSLQKLFFSFFFSFLAFSTYSQTPSNCFEIESVLADACGYPEGENEMVRFKIGNSPLNIADMIVDWPNNPYLGICQNALTAQVVSDLNATIVSCGILIEPVGGILPAGSNVLLITSDSIDVTANSFTNLTDTLYTIFQCSGNTNGHFVNYSNIPGLRTLAISFTNPPGCTDTVIYDKSLLINQNGTYGGSTAVKNGARIDFTWNGIPTYENDGCQAPIIISNIFISTLSSSDTVTICPGDSIIFISSPIGGYNSLYWQGGDGIFSFQDTINTIYYSTANDTLPFYIYGGLESYCNDSIRDSIFVDIMPKPIVSLSTLVTDLCPSQSINLTGSGASTYLWNTSETTPSISINTAGFYYLTGSNGCFSDSASITITATGFNPLVSVSGISNICSGDSTVLTAASNLPFTWSTGEITSPITITSPQNVYAYSTNICGSDTAFITIGSLGSTPLISISGNLSICNGDSTTLIAVGDTAYTWSTGDTTINITVNSPQNLYVFSTNICGADTVFVDVVSLGLPPSITLTGVDSLCLGDSTLLIASGGTNYTWSTGDTSNTLYVTTPQNVFVYSTNSCGVDSAFLTITSYGSLPNALITGTSWICNYGTTQLVASGGDSYTWSDGSTNDSIVVSSAQTLYVIAQNICGIDSMYFSVTEESITAAFIMSDSVGYIPLTVDFTNQSINASIYTWYFGDSTMSSTENPSNTFENEGFYTVSLTVRNSFGCADTTIETVHILPIPALIIPNVFSPNGDGQNNIFKVNASSYTSINATIYNRWGQIMFQWNELNTGWDGNYDGKAASEGTYFYTISVGTSTNSEEIYAGSFSLFR